MWSKLGVSIAGVFGIWSAWSYSRSVCNSKIICDLSNPFNHFLIESCHSLKSRFWFVLYLNN